MRKLISSKDDKLTLTILTEGHTTLTQETEVQSDVSDAQTITIPFIRNKARSFCTVEQQTHKIVIA